MNNDGDGRFHRGPRFGWFLVGVILLVVFAFLILLAIRLLFPSAHVQYYYGSSVFPLLFFPLGILFFLLFVLVIARLIFWPWRWGYRGAYWHHYGDAREVVKERYARGEITKEQFDQMMRDLEQHA